MTTFNFKQRVTFIIATIVLIVSFCMISAWVQFLHRPLVVRDEGFRYEVREGTSIHAVVHDLYLLDIIKHPYFFNLLIWLRGDRHNLKAGEYLFPKGITASRLLTQITSGSGMVYHEFTLIAGWDFGRVRRMLAADPNLKHTSEKMSDAEIMQSLDHPELKPEGWFFPDTYYFVRGTSDLVVLKQAFTRMQKILMNAWDDRASDLPYYTPQDALTVASLVEKETSIPHERPIIAGVIVNRLRKGMLLQIDPTVIYAAGSNFHGTIHRSDLLRKSPYNTYVTKGLPPTPIAMPGGTSILAAMHPLHHDYLYFVAENYDMNGPHRFSATLEEHYSAIARAKHGKSTLEFFNNDLIQHYFWRTLLLPGIFQ
ncbi:MAG: endolytic transglycosylase MltG [Gammaproteobacteria bacterium]|nr:endolytic transglycosylase MltG [Gammaproteobacteria bacterium]